MTIKLDDFVQIGPTRMIHLDHVREIYWEDGDFAIVFTNGEKTNVEKGSKFYETLVAARNQRS